ARDEAPVADRLGDLAVRIAEGHALADEPLCLVRRKERRIGGRGGEPDAVEVEPANENRKRSERAADVASRTTHGLLVLLQVAVVRERQALHGREQAGEAPDRRPGLPARELGDV